MPVTAAIYGLLLIQDNHIDAGQILIALDAALLPGKRRTTNQHLDMAADLPGVEAGPTRWRRSLFVKAAIGPVTLTVAACCRSARCRTAGTRRPTSAP